MKDVILIDDLKADKKYFVDDGERKAFLIFLTGKKDYSGDVKVIIKGKDADVQILGVIIGAGKQKINLYTLQEHEKERSISDLFIKSVLFEEARLNYQGLIKIDKYAQHSNAYQKNQNILMSKTAWADSRPYLEILANDVRCTHGATVGRLDENQLYYLKTRGLGQDSAKKLLLNGFFQEIFDRISDNQLVDQLVNQTKKSLSEFL